MAVTEQTANPLSQFLYALKAPEAVFPAKFQLIISLYFKMYFNFLRTSILDSECLSGMVKNQKNPKNSTLEK
jgi:hypothetical protein